ncbi:unnamed protein product [Oikopleura dioica]|uniref:Uncharacterized protein n=1 Tax=Oikopleura dioica TaxID=34765 RepID=E4YT31_OIKDI|nr:unnamed protein product [Oikopleura dioica]
MSQDNLRSWKLYIRFYSLYTRTKRKTLLGEKFKKKLQLKSNKKKGSNRKWFRIQPPLMWTRSPGAITTIKKLFSQS